jgi:hypothetical protein
MSIGEKVEFNGISLELEGHFLLPNVVELNDNLTVQLLHPKVKECSI